MLFNKLFKALKARQVLLAGVLLSVGVGTCGLSPIVAAELETPATKSSEVAAAKLPASDTTAADNNNQMENGIYLYGESPTPEQIGKEYVVFEARGDKVVGAFYMPTSEYSCFYGNVKNNEMDLTVVDTHNSSTYAHSIALQRKSLVASNNQIGLQGYDPVGRISALDKKILNVCRVTVQK